jgi:hypothetical protein
VYLEPSQLQYVPFNSFPTFSDFRSWSLVISGWQMLAVGSHQEGPGIETMKALRTTKGLEPLEPGLRSASTASTDIRPAKFHGRFFWRGMLLSIAALINLRAI